MQGVGTEMGILYLNECLWKYLFYLRTTSKARLGWRGESEG